MPGGKWEHDKFQASRSPGMGAAAPTKLLISNLDYGVSDSDIQVKLLHVDLYKRWDGKVHVVL